MCKSPRMLEESSLFKPEEVSTLPGISTLPFPPAKQRAAPVIRSTLCHPVSVRQLQLFACSTSLSCKASASRETQCSQSCSDSVLMPWKKCAGKYLAEVWGISRIFLEQRENTNSLAFVPNSSSKSRSGPSEESLELVNLWVMYAPRGPQPALLQLQCDSALWERPTPPAVSLRADLVNGGAPNLHLVVELVQAVCEVMHCAGAQRTTLSSWLVGWVLRPLGSDIGVSAGGKTEREEDVNPCCSLLSY